MDELLRLPGRRAQDGECRVGRARRHEGIVVDTHVRRLSQRLGLTQQEDPVKIERDLVRLVPREDWARFAHLLIWHGRRVCDARRPRCEDCVLARSVPVEPPVTAASNYSQRSEESPLNVAGGAQDARSERGSSMNARIRGAFVGVAVVAAALVGGEALSKPPAVVPSNAESLTSIPAEVVAIANGRNRATTRHSRALPVSGAALVHGHSPPAWRDGGHSLHVASSTRRSRSPGRPLAPRIPVACAGAENLHGRARLAWYTHTAART